VEPFLTDLGWTDLSDADRERQYSPSSCLPDGDYRPFVAAYRDRSDAAWATVEGRPDVETAIVRYGDHESHSIDVVVPSPTGGATPPMLAFIHGGYWQELSKHDSRFAAAACADLGWAFAAVDYTLAPHASLDEIVIECRDAIARLGIEADGLGFDADRVVVAGSSAGAHLVAMLASDPAVGVAGTVLISGVFDLAPLVGTSINDAVGLDVDDALRNSPIHRTVESFPPTVLAYGSIETEQFKAQTAAFARHLEQAGVPIEQVEVAGRNHFDVVFDLAAPETVLGGAVASLIDSTNRTTGAGSAEPDG